MWKNQRACGILLKTMNQKLQDKIRELNNSYQHFLDTCEAIVKSGNSRTGVEASIELEKVKNISKSVKFLEDIGF